MSTALLPALLSADNDMAHYKNRGLKNKNITIIYDSTLYISILGFLKDIFKYKPMEMELLKHK